MYSSVADNKNFHTAGVEYDQPYLYCTLTQPGDKVSLTLVFNNFNFLKIIYDSRLLSVVLSLFFFVSFQPLSCPPAMRLVTVQKQTKTLKYLLRGDSEGVVLWTVPEVTTQQLAQICQNDRSTPLSLPPTIKTSITMAWEEMKPPPVGILDQLDSGDGHGIKLTASIYLPQQSRLVVGREDGSIIIVPATQTVMLQLLHGNHQQYDGTI